MVDSYTALPVGILNGESTNGRYILASVGDGQILIAQPSEIFPDHSILYEAFRVVQREGSTIQPAKFLGDLLADGKITMNTFDAFRQRVSQCPALEAAISEVDSLGSPLADRPYFGGRYEADVDSMALFGDSGKYPRPDDWAERLEPYLALLVTYFEGIGQPREVTIDAKRKTRRELLLQD